jgi:phage-related protein
LGRAGRGWRLSCQKRIDKTTYMLYALDIIIVVLLFLKRSKLMNVHHYKTAGGKDLILDYIMSLSKPEIIDGLSVLECFENDELDMLTLKPWRGKVWEVYFYKHNRIFYVAIDNKDAYLLHACRKQKNKTEKSESETVISRAKELGERLSNRII